MENVCNRCTIDFIEKDEPEKFMKQQPKLTFNCIHKSFESCDGYIFKQIEVLMVKPICLGFAIFELSKLHMYET